jgi:hypothetical protein
VDKYGAIICKSLDPVRMSKLEKGKVKVRRHKSLPKINVKSK